METPEQAEAAASQAASIRSLSRPSLKHPRYLEIPPLEFETEAELGPISVPEGRARPLSAAVTLRLAERAAVKVGVDVVAGIVAIPDVVHFPYDPELHVFADLEGIRGSKIKFDKWLPAEAVRLKFIAAESVGGIRASAVDR